MTGQKLVVTLYVCMCVYVCVYICMYLPAFSKPHLFVPSNQHGEFYEHTSNLIILERGSMLWIRGLKSQFVEFKK